ncbi:mechanosensitive ion channel family protein [Cupriavidus basilensis]
MARIEGLHPRGIRTDPHEPALQRQLSPIHRAERRHRAGRHAGREEFINRFFQARQQGDKDNRGSYRTWTVASRNAVAAVVFLLLLGIWVSELKSVAISLTAFAVALVIGGKELVMCFLGAFLRMMARPFQLGDIVEIGPHSGEVVDMDALTTTLVEIAGARQFTGSTVQIPNSMLLTVAVRNHSQSGKYTLDTLRIPLPEKSDPDRVEADLIAITEASVRAVPGRGQAQPAGIRRLALSRSLAVRAPRDVRSHGGGPARCAGALPGAGELAAVDRAADPAQIPPAAQRGTGVGGRQAGVRAGRRARASRQGGVAFLNLRGFAGGGGQGRKGMHRLHRMAFRLYGSRAAAPPPLLPRLGTAAVANCVEPDRTISKQRGDP